MVDLSGTEKPARRWLYPGRLRRPPARSISRAGRCCAVCCSDSPRRTTSSHCPCSHRQRRLVVGILIREVSTLYTAFVEGRPSPLAGVACAIRGILRRGSSWLQGEILEGEVSFWRRQLAGLPPLLELPTDRCGPPCRASGSSQPVRLPAELTRQVEALSRREGATLFMVLLAGFQAFPRALWRTAGSRGRHPCRRTQSGRD